MTRFARRRIRAEKEAEEARLEAERKAEELRQLKERSGTAICNAVRCFLAKAALTKLQAARKEVESAAAVAIETTVRVLLAKKKARTRKRMRDDEQKRTFQNAAVNIQRMVRGYLAQIEYNIQRFAAEVIQSTVRAYSARGRYLKMAAGFNQLQAVVRGAEARAMIARQNQAAVTLQRHFRRLLAEIAFAVMDLQSTKIQSVARMYLAKTIMHNRRMEVERAAEAAFRQQIFDAGVMALQSVARMRVAKRSFEEKRGAAVEVQRVVRGFLSRNEIFFAHFAATEIQRMWRGSTQQINYMLMLLGSIKVQSVCRMFIQRARFARSLGAVRSVQRWWRNALMAQGEREITAAIVMQKIARR